MPACSSIAVTTALLLATPGPDRASASRSAAAPRPAHTIYLHTEGLTLQVSTPSDAGCLPSSDNCSVSDSRTNTSWLPTLPATSLDIPAMRTKDFGDDAKAVRLALAAEVQAIFAGIDLEVVIRRPDDDRPYTMVVIGGGPDAIGMGPGIAGLAPLDCGDLNPWDVVFVFSEVIGELSGVARIAVQEASHAFGLEHVAESPYVMYPQPAHSSRGLGFACMQIEPSPDLSNPDGIKCRHTCPVATFQNSYFELLERFGPSTSNPLPDDSVPPTIHFRTPAPGAYYAISPDALAVTLAADDNLGVLTSFLSINGGPEIEDSTLPFGFRLEKLPAGRHTLRARVVDAAGNSQVAETLLDVGDEEAVGHDDPPPLGTEVIHPVIQAQEQHLAHCANDASCYSGTVCSDGICVREIPPSCTLSPGAGRDSTLPLGLLALLYVSVRTKPRRCQSRCAAARLW